MVSWCDDQICEGRLQCSPYPLSASCSLCICRVTVSDSEWLQGFAGSDPSPMIPAHLTVKRHAQTIDEFVPALTAPSS